MGSETLVDDEETRELRDSYATAKVRGNLFFLSSLQTWPKGQEENNSTPSYLIFYYGTPINDCVY